jgi:hypothetical protein
MFVWVATTASPPSAQNPLDRVPPADELRVATDVGEEPPLVPVLKLSTLVLTSAEW